MAGFLWRVNHSGGQAVGSLFDGSDGFFHAAKILLSETETPTWAETYPPTAANKKHKRPVANIFKIVEKFANSILMVYWLLIYSLRVSERSYHFKQVNNLNRFGCGSLYWLSRIKHYFKRNNLNFDKKIINIYDSSIIDVNHSGL